MPKKSDVKEKSEFFSKIYFKRLIRQLRTSFTTEEFTERYRKTLKDTERYRKTQKDTERHRKTQKDPERKHEKLEKCEIHQKAIKNILNLSCHFGFFVKFVQDTFSAFFPLSFQCESESFCVLSGEIGTWISTPFPEVPDFHGNEH